MDQRAGAGGGQSQSQHHRAAACHAYVRRKAKRR